MLTWLERVVVRTWSATETVILGNDAVGTDCVERLAFLMPLLSTEIGDSRFIPVAEAVEVEVVD